MFLEIKDLQIGYKTPLIKQINADLQEGEICLLIGNNGVGKTTLIKTLLKQLSPLKGEIKIDDSPINSYSSEALAKKIAIVFSKAQTPDTYTVTDLISFGKYVHYPYYFQLNLQDQIEVQEIIKQLGLTTYKNLKLTQLSDGNLQKAFIGRALSQNTPFIILDEPTTHLDEENKIMILQLLRKLAKEKNKIILFSSHDWRLAKEFTDKVWYVKNEKLFSGITEDVLLAHAELIRPQLFQFNQKFIAPKITAPKIEAEMLYSFLQKNFPKDFSDTSFSFSKELWTISSPIIQKTVKSFEEISEILSSSH